MAEATEAVDNVDWRDKGKKQLLETREDSPVVGAIWDKLWSLLEEQEESRQEGTERNIASCLLWFSSLRVVSSTS